MTTGALSSEAAMAAAGADLARRTDPWGDGPWSDTQWSDGRELSVVRENPPRLARGLASWKVLALADALAGLVVMALAALAATRIAGPTQRSLAQDGLLVGVTWGSLLVAVAAKRLYAQARRHLTSATTASLAPLVEAVVTAALVVLAADALAGPALRRAIPPPVAVAAFGACLLALPGARALALGAQARRGRVTTRVIVVGTGTVATDLAARLDRSPQVELVGFVDDDPADLAGTAGSTRVLGGLDALVDLCERHDVTRVVVAFSRSHPDAATPQLRRLADHIAIDVVPRYFELTGWDASIGDLSGLPVVNLHDGPAHGLAPATKRAFDIAVAACGLALSAPLLLPLILAVRLTSSGPALFCQTRLGRDRERFRILKLRTMYTQEEGETESAADRRPGTIDLNRVTPLGAFLRRSGLDELPQLWNVLVGHMSLVGPRPFIPAECRGLPDWSDTRFAVRPGMTGLWQVSGQHHLRFEELCRLDVLYVSRWSLGADLRILARTPARLIHGGGDGQAVAD